MLVSDVVADKLVGLCNLDKNSRVLEIGTGLGFVTRRLVEQIRVRRKRRGRYSTICQSRREFERNQKSRTCLCGCFRIRLQGRKI